jgi:hypothetical protein
LNAADRALAGSVLGPRFHLSTAAVAAWEESCMNVLHHMLPEDEVFLCGTVLLYGILAGVVARLLVAYFGRRAA